MTDLETTIASFHERLNAVRDEIEAEFSNLFEELDEARSAADQVKSAENDSDKRIKQLEERAEGQAELIETLTQEAEEARALRDEVRERELELDSLSSELDSKNDLVKALRLQLENGVELKTTAKQRDKKIFEQQHELDRRQKELDRSAREIAELKDEIEAENERAAEETVVDNAELVALKAELDARKTMIKSLKADAERAESLEARLEAKREAVNALEEAIDQHSETISELKRSVDTWKAKYQAAKGAELKDEDHTMTELPALTDTEIDVLRELEGSTEDAPAQTVAIDMRDALKEARRKKTST